MRALLAILLSASCAVASAHEKPKPPPEPTHSVWLTPDNSGGKDAHLVGSALIGAGLSASLQARPGRN